MSIPKRKVVFQKTIFRCYVSFNSRRVYILYEFMCVIIYLNAQILYYYSISCISTTHQSFCLQMHLSGRSHIFVDVEMKLQPPATTWKILFCKVRNRVTMNPKASTAFVYRSTLLLTQDSSHKWVGLGLGIPDPKNGMILVVTLTQWWGSSKRSCSSTWNPKSKYLEKFMLSAGGFWGYWASKP